MGCKYPACSRPHTALGYCMTHYQQIREGRELRPTYANAKERFWSKVNKTDNCWEWVAAKNKRGYGHCRFDGRTQLAHRVSYVEAHGPIPEGMQLDHICHNRACVRPSHLRAVTSKQNNENLRGAAKTNTLGVRGVHWHARDKRWRARVTHEYQQIQVGYFVRLEDAEAAVIAKRLELFTHNDKDRAHVLNPDELKRKKSTNE